MKKIIFILVVILGAVCLVLSILGWGGEYTAEKLFYRAMKLNSKIAVNPEVAPPMLLASVESDLQKLLKKYPKSNTAKTANIALAEFYVSNKKYDKALAQINVIMNTYGQDIPTASTAQFLKGLTYEKQNRWNKALAEYMLLRDKYTNTDLGIQVPLYIGRYYAGKGKQDEANKAYNEAALFYEKLEQNNRGKMLGYIASTLLMQAYLNLRDYNGAGKAVEDAFNNYPYQLTVAQFLPYVEPIFIGKLNKPEKALKIYKNLKEKTRDAKLIRLLETRIKKLEAKN